MIRPYHSYNEQQTHDIGREIGSRLTPPRVILLSGDLGSGKTLFTRGLAAGLEVEGTVVVRSPTFTLVNEYQGKFGTIYHIDLYRLEGLRDQHSIGLEEILASHSIVVVEWGEKLLVQPRNPLIISISVDTRTEARHFEAKPPIQELTRVS